MTDPALLARVRARDELENRRCAEDAWYWLSRHVWTKDEHAPGQYSIRKFPSLEYLEYLTTIIQERTRDAAGVWRQRYHTVVIGKSRDVLATWLAIALCVHRARFEANRLVIVQSKTEDDVKSGGKARKVQGGAEPKGTGFGLLGRAHAIEGEMTPGLRIPGLPLNSDEIPYPNGSFLKGIAHGQHKARGHKPSLFFADELAFHGNEAAATWHGIQPSVASGLGQLLAVSTPNQQEFFYTLAPWDKDGGWRDWPQPVTGVHTLDFGDGKIALFVHYTADPEKRSVDYRKRVMALHATEDGLSGERYFRQEYEGDFGVRAGDPVWPEFVEAIHTLPNCPPFDPRKPLWRGWDFGYQGQACVWAQEGVGGQVVVHSALLEQKLGLESYVPLVKARFVEAGSVIDVGDPSAMAHNPQGETVEATLKAHGIVIRTKPTTGRKQDLLDQVRNLFGMRGDGTPGIVFCRKCCATLVSAMNGGYHFAEVKPGQAAKDVPHKDGTYDHPADALQYLIDHLRPGRSRGQVRTAKTRFYEPAVVPGVGYRGYTRGS